MFQVLLYLLQHHDRVVRCLPWGRERLPLKSISAMGGCARSARWSGGVLGRSDRTIANLYYTLW